MLLTLSVYCLLIVAASLLGGRVSQWIQLTHNRLQLLISFVGGLMLGIALFHLLPHSVGELGAGGIDRAMVSMTIGLLVMFFLLRMFHFHQHEPAGLTTEAAAPCGPRPHDHDHHHSADHHHHAAAVHELSWLGVFIGLSVHTLMDGLALGASLQADARHQNGTLSMGLGTFLAILLHKPLDALSITSLMKASGMDLRFQTAVNAAFALMCPLGAFLFVGGSNVLIEQQSLLVGTALAFSAGVFLCISLSDLLPEMEFHSHNRLGLSMALLLGIGLAWIIRWLEPAALHASS